MWEIRTQFSRPMKDGTSTNLEWSAIQVETQSEAEAWWRTRTTGRSIVRRVHTMFDPQGSVVQVQFD